MMHVGEDGVRNLDALKSLGAAGRAAIAALPKFVSVDSHIQEPDAVWEQLPPRLYEKFQEETKRLRFKGEMPGGAMDPKLRLLDQDTDNVEVDALLGGIFPIGVEHIEAQLALFFIGHRLGLFIEPPRQGAVHCHLLVFLDHDISSKGCAKIGATGWGLKTP